MFTPRLTSSLDFRKTTKGSAGGASITDLGWAQLRAAPYSQRRRDRRIPAPKSDRSIGVSEGNRSSVGYFRKLARGTASSQALFALVQGIRGSETELLCPLAPSLAVCTCTFAITPFPVHRRSFSSCIIPDRRYVLISNNTCQLEKQHVLVEEHSLSPHSTSR